MGIYAGKMKCLLFRLGSYQAVVFMPSATNAVLQRPSPISLKFHGPR
jgi:hypothetical protein